MAFDQQLADALTEIEQLRATNTRLHRRCQSAEAGLRARIEPGGRTFGRGLANCAAAMYREQNEELRAVLLEMCEMQQRCQWQADPAAAYCGDFAFWGYVSHEPLHCDKHQKYHRECDWADPLRAALRLLGRTPVDDGPQTASPEGGFRDDDPCDGAAKGDAMTQLPPQPTFVKPGDFLFATVGDATDERIRQTYNLPADWPIERLKNGWASWREPATSAQ